MRNLLRFFLRHTRRINELIQGLPDDKLVALINSGKIHPTLTLAEAKVLTRDGPQETADLMWKLIKISFHTSPQELVDRCVPRLIGAANAIPSVDEMRKWTEWAMTCAVLYVQKHAAEIADEADEFDRHDRGIDEAGAKKLAAEEDRNFAEADDAQEAVPPQSTGRVRVGLPSTRRVRTLNART